MEPPRIIAGLFVGGTSRRMGGVPKALLAAPDRLDDTILERSIRMLREGGVNDVVLVGAAPWLPERLRGMPCIADRVRDAGPLAGLATLLEEAVRRGASRVIAMACDMPYVSASLVARLVHTDTPRAIVAPRGSSHPTRWDALFARYEHERVALVVDALLRERRLAMQGVFDGVEAEPLALDDRERALLRDWDSPDDVERDSHG
jgi:molybdopterin-guanine dinucleotide biosynthesis protein A